MLQMLRDKSQGVIAIVIMGFIAMTFALWGIHNYFNGSSADAPIAKVNGHKITNRVFQSAFNRFRQMQSQKNPNLLTSQAAIKQSKSDVLQSLITTSLLTQSAADNGFSIGRDLLMLELARLPLFQSDGQFSKMRFQVFLRNAMFTQQQFLAQLSNSMVLAQVRTGFLFSSFSLPYQIGNTVKLVNQTRSFHYVMVPVTKFMHHMQLPTQAAQAYYKTHQASYQLPEKVSVHYLELSMADIMKGFHPSSEQLQTYYADHLNHYTLPKKWDLAHIILAVPANTSAKATAKIELKAQKLYESLIKGISFNAYAKKYSDDLATADKGGVLPTMTLMQKSSVWQRHMLQLKHVGQVSQPFKTPMGFEILKLKAIHPAVVKPYKQVAAAVLKDYRQQKAEKIYADKSDQLANLVFEHPNSLQPAADQLGLHIRTTPMFAQKITGRKGLVNNPKVVAAAFSNEVLNQGNNSDTVQVNDTSMLVLRVAKKAPATVKSFASVKQGIETNLTHQLAMKKAQSLAMKILVQAQKGASFAHIAQAAGLKVGAVNHVARNGEVKSVNPAIVAAAFDAPTPKGKNKPSYVITDVDGLGYATVQINHVTEGKIKKIPQNVMSAYREGTASNSGVLDYTLYVKGLRDSAKIKLYAAKQ
jgi:peptidyl-prolyl cis-trans isomerase D